MKRTGQLLKETREKRGVTLNEVSHVTKINIKTLEAIEQGTTDSLPQKAFIRGFVQTYAKYLGLNVSEVLDLFQEEMGQTKPELPTAEKPIKEVSSAATHVKARQEFENEIGSGSKKWVIGILSLVLVGAIFFVFQLIEKYEKESQVPEPIATETPAIVATADTLSDSLVAISASTNTSVESDNEASSAATGPEMGVPPGPVVAVSPVVSTTTSTVTTTTVTTTTVKITTTTTTVKTTTTTTTRTTTTTSSTSTTTRTVRATTTTTTVPPNTTTTTLVEREIEVIVEALDKVSFGFRIDGGEFRTLSLSPEQIHTFKAKQRINVDVSDGGAVNVIVNGIDRGVPGTLGQPIKLKFP